MSFSSGPSGQTARPLPGPLPGASSSRRRGGPPVIWCARSRELPSPRHAPALPLSLRPFHEPHICLPRGRERAPSSFLGSSADRLLSLGVASAAVTGLAGCWGGGDKWGSAAGHGFWPWRENRSLVPERQAGGWCRLLTLLCQSGPVPRPHSGSLRCHGEQEWGLRAQKGRPLSEELGSAERTGFLGSRTFLSVCCFPPATPISCFFLLGHTSRPLRLEGSFPSSIFEVPGV